MGGGSRSLLAGRCWSLLVALPPSWLGVWWLAGTSVPTAVSPKTLTNTLLPCPSSAANPLSPTSAERNYGPGSLYTDMDAASADILADLDDELTVIRDALAERYGSSSSSSSEALDLSSCLPVVERIRQQYGGQVSDYSSVQSTFNTAAMYTKSKFAMTEAPDGKTSAKGQRCVLIIF